MKNVYFLSDAHLGSRAIEHGRTQERRLVNFLDSIKHKASAVYLLGDMFDFWYEFRLVVPKGYTRFLGKLSELTDMGVEVHLAHGDGLGDPDKKFKLLRWMFHSTTLQTLFSAIHPRWSVELGLTWAKHSREKRVDGKEPDYMGENKEHLVLYTKEYLKSHPNINFFIYGHRHIELDLMLSATSRVLILGDWINYFSYAVFDGENLFLEEYIEGETQV